MPWKVPHLIYKWFPEVSLGAHRGFPRCFLSHVSIFTRADRWGEAGEGLRIPHNWEWFYIFQNYSETHPNVKGKLVFCTFNIFFVFFNLIFLKPKTSSWRWFSKLGTNKKYQYLNMDCHIHMWVPIRTKQFKVSDIGSLIHRENTLFPLLQKDPEKNLRNGSGQIDYYIFYRNSAGNAMI